jgi:hypothetical protein
MNFRACGKGDAILSGNSTYVEEQGRKITVRLRDKFRFLRKLCPS